MHEIPTQIEYENALEGDMDLNKKIIKLSELKELAYEDLILSIESSSSIGKVAFRLVRMQRMQIFPRETARSCGTGW